MSRAQHCLQISRGSSTWPSSGSFSTPRLYCESNSPETSVENHFERPPCIQLQSGWPRISRHPIESDLEANAESKIEIMQVAHQRTPFLTADASAIPP